jgi:DNA-binding response OmpR family regulator
MRRLRCRAQGFAGAWLLRLDTGLPADAASGGCDCGLAHALAAGVLLPRCRTVGPLTLDLVHRDAHCCGAWLHLHPREFALLWRLADRPGACVTRAELWRDVWRLRHLPETNSVAVHISRLRAKLAAAGCGSLVETDPVGGYRLDLGREGYSK